MTRVGLRVGRAWFVLSLVAGGGRRAEGGGKGRGRRAQENERAAW